MVRVSGKKLPSKVMVESTLERVDDRDAVANMRGGSGWESSATAPHSCQEKGSTGSDVLGGGGGTLV